MNLSAAYAAGNWDDDRVLTAYRAVVVKDSKLVMPTSSPVKVLGFKIDGRRGTLRLPSDLQLSLIRSTLSAIRSYEMTGRQLAHLIGWEACFV